MRVSRNFVKVFLLLFLVSIGLNLVALGLKVWNQWFGWAFLGLVVVLFFLIFRKHTVGFIKFLAWTLPLILVLAILYVNFLPFGFHKEYTINVLEDGTVVSSSSQAWLEDLKGKKITNLTDLYSYGSINLVVKPKAVLKNATVNVSVVGDDVYLAKLDLSNVSWDYNWDFTKGIPAPLNGTAKYSEEKGCVYFNGSNNETLSYPNSSDMFENDSFIVYVEWKPEELKENELRSQIIGHYNWEIWQYKDKVRFAIASKDEKGAFFPAIEETITQSFFNKTHSLEAEYYHSQNNSYIELFIDNKFIGRKNFSINTIYREYNGNRNLTIGKSDHGDSNYLSGCVYLSKVYSGNGKYLKKDSIKMSNAEVAIPFFVENRLDNIKLTIEQ